MCLQQLIIQKAAEDLRKQKETEAEERERVINVRVPELNINGLGKGKPTYKSSFLNDECTFF